VEVVVVALGERMEATRPVRRGVSKGVEDGCKPPTLRAGHPARRA
jgi:hypothetical protein